MTGFGELAQAAFVSEPLALQTADLLGGTRILKQDVTTPMQVHSLLAAGLPGAALNFFGDHLKVLDAASLEKATGISVRTAQRRKADPSQLLSVEQSGRTWKFAEILAQATAVMGDQGEAEQWLEEPARGLDFHRPIDLLSTPAGITMVERLLGQIAYGVYV